jgi:hypothetical protein
MSFWARMFGKDAAEAEVVQPELAPESVADPDPIPEPDPVPEPEPVAEPPTVEHVAVVREPEPEPGAPEPEPVAAAPVPKPELAAPEVAPEPRRAAGPVTENDLEARLTAVLDSLGSAHRRPFVRNG